MKAWKIYMVQDDTWSIPYHAETASGAKKAAFGGYFFDGCDWVDLRALRYPKLDDKPFTFENCQTDYTGMDGDELTPNDWYNDCSCDICRESRAASR